MKRALTICAVLGLGSLAALNSLAPAPAENWPTQAAVREQTITFAVGNMTCAACPITVRKAMERVDGVESVTVDFEARTATVVFDPAVATPGQIAAASADVGYPATPLTQDLR